MDLTFSFCLVQCGLVGVSRSQTNDQKDKAYRYEMFIGLKPVFKLLKDFIRIFVLIKEIKKNDFSNWKTNNESTELLKNSFG